MTKRFLAAAALAGIVLVPATASAQRVTVPNVELFATVTGKWVLDPRRCKDIREDIRDARKNENRRDRREDRIDQRIADCPAKAYDFVVDAGQGPKFPVRVSRGRVPRKYRGKPMFINGDTIGPNGQPVESRGVVYTPSQQPTYIQPIAPRPTYQQPAYQQPTYQQPTYAQPTYQQPAYQQPTYQPAPSTTYTQPSYQAPAPTPAPAAPSNYEVRNGVIYWLD